MSDGLVTAPIPQASPHWAVAAEGVVKDYTSGTETLRILQGTSLFARAGETVAVMGQSGSGKSTLLNILGGLDRCDAGVIRIAGADITRLPESGLSAFRQRSVGFIFQFHYLLKDFTALENIMLPGYIAGMKKKAALEKARALLTGMGLENRAGHYPPELSGGERQRVAAARAMVNDPALILADEPTGNLDAHNSALVAELLYGEAEKRGTTLIVVTHDKNIAAMAHTRYSLENGILQGAGSAA